jgi:hypothetical protein
MVLDLNAEDRRLGRTIVRDFVTAVRTANLSLVLDLLEQIDERSLWLSAFRAVAKVPCPDDDFRLGFLRVWVHDGNTIRDKVDNDLVLVAGLRSLLPPYSGPAVTLYRGESAWNERRRTYGLAWSANVDVARDFATTGMCRRSKGGSVLLETLAPPEAIVCAPALMGTRYSEQEYLIDRRRLPTVKVLERFEQAPA